MKKAQVQEIEWFTRANHLYYDEEEHPHDRKKILAPVRLITPFPESDVLDTDFGDVTAKWIIRLTSKKEGPTSERWNFELELVDSELKKESGSPTKKQMKERNKRRIIDVAVEVKCILIFLNKEGNTTIYSTYPDYQNNFKKEDPICFLGWPDNMPGKNYGRNIVRKQKPLIFQDGTLRVVVRLEYCGSSVVPKADQMLVTSHAPTLTLLADMQNLLESGLNSDVTIKSGSSTLKAHKLILSLRSPVLNAMLNSDMVEANSGVIKIDDLDPPVIKHLLNYIYSSKLDTTQMKHQEIVGLIQAGEKYQLATLKDYCFNSLFANLNDETCGELAMLSYVYNARDDQKTAVYNYNTERWSILSAKVEFKEWVKKYPAAFLKP